MIGSSRGEAVVKIATGTIEAPGSVGDDMTARARDRAGCWGRAKEDGIKNQSNPESRPAQYSIGS